jgi:cytochrome c oxidase assembly factor CtaG
MNIWVDTNGWPFPPIVLLGCLIAEILYFRGWCVLITGIQAKEDARTTITSVFTSLYDGEAQWRRWLWRGIFFVSTICIFLVASSAPIDILSGRLFWVHMVQHLLLLVVVAPLFVASAPWLPLWLGLPRLARRFLKASVKLNVRRALYCTANWLRQPVISCALLIIGIWVWHWPPLYDLALTNDIIHDWCEHSIFLAVSILFWPQVISSPPLRSSTGSLGRIVCLGIAILQNLVLAVLIGFAPAPLYAPYAHLATVIGGLSALQDQQFGAGIMWTFGDLPFGIALSILIQQCLASQDENNTHGTIASHQQEASTETAKSTT